MLRAGLAFALACFAATAVAEEPVEPMGASGRASLSAAFTSGNAASRRLFADGDFVHRSPERRYQLSGRAERRSEEGADSVSIWRAAANRDAFLDERRFAYLRAALEHDGAKDLQRRTSAGAGLGADLVREERAQVSLRGGLDLVDERRYGFDARRYPALGWALKASYVLERSKAELFHEHDGLRDLREGGVVVHSKTGVRIPLAAKLSASVQVNLDWESRPAPGRKPVDAALLVGASYAW